MANCVIINFILVSQLPRAHQMNGVVVEDVNSFLVRRLLVALLVSLLAECTGLLTKSILVFITYAFCDIIDIETHA